MKPLTTTNARASRAHEVQAVLEDAFAALTLLDATKLEALEDRVAELIADGGRTIFASDQTERQAELREVTSRHRLLGKLLATTELNLGVLGRLHNRHAIGDSAWAR